MLQNKTSPNGNILQLYQFQTAPYVKHLLTVPRLMYSGTLVGGFPINTWWLYQDWCIVEPWLVVSPSTLDDCTKIDVCSGPRIGGHPIRVTNTVTLTQFYVCNKDYCYTQTSMGGGWGDASPTFQGRGQHRNCPPTFHFRKIARHIAWLNTPLSKAAT